MTYELKDKINVTKELLDDLDIKSWQEIDYLQAQIANLAEGPINDKLRQLFKNLLISYYVFTGSIETLASEFNNQEIEVNKASEEVRAPVLVEPDLEELEPKITTSNKDTSFTDDYTENCEASEPFEYFVDFDDPIGEPISDEDLYN